MRPTSEDVRARWLDHLEERLAGARVVDLFAGSGGLGLEALSRGAASADFVENGPQALHALKANVARLGLRPERQAVRIFKRDAIPFVDGLERHAYDVAFADPPYGSAKLDRVISAWRTSEFARVLGVEHAQDHPVPRGAHRLDFGDTVVTIYGLRAKATRKRR